MQRIRVALLGLGTVGSGVVRILADVGGRDPRLERIDLVGIAVRDINKVRDLTIAGGLLTDDPFALVRDPEVDVVIEMMGGVELPYTLLSAALKQGKHVVTANKALLARHGRELFELARSRGVTIRYEAAIGGGTPLVQPLQQCFGANRIRSVTAIINGTTNYILTQMLTRSLAYEDALAEAQSLGYAEADPRADVEGNDAQEKIALLAAIAYRIALPDLASVYREGITAIHEQDVRHAQRLGFVIKLLALAVREPDGRLDLRVHPTLVPTDHPLSRVDGAYNAVLIEGEPVGSVMFYGPGAGSGPTASAIVADLVNTLIDLQSPALELAPPDTNSPDRLPIAEVRTRFYIRLLARDRPGVIGQLGQIFGQHAVSLESIVQKNPPRGAAAELVIITHNVREADLRLALDEICETDVLQELCSAIRVLPD